MNPVREKLVGAPEEYAHSSAANGVELDECPPWLKPQARGADTRG